VRLCAVLHQIVAHHGIHDCLRLYCRFATHIPCEGRHQGCS
jgi:hypothetical protein